VHILMHVLVHILVCVLMYALVCVLVHVLVCVLVCALTEKHISLVVPCRQCLLCFLCYSVLQLLCMSYRWLATCIFSLAMGWASSVASWVWILQAQSQVHCKQSVRNRPSLASLQ
jgi:hypothetical protein